MPTLDWIGKKAVLNHHNEVPFRLLKCKPELSVGDPGSGNLLIHGDNLEALKALLPYYAGKVKCIYIDPPYNTGNENWIYNDAVNSPEMKAWLGKVVGKEAEDLSRHDKWLCMMWPRLKLIRELLHRQGLIFVSIGIDEVGHLRVMADEIFGRKNLVEILIWNNEGHTENQYEITNVHEYVLVYAKVIENFRVRTVIDPNVPAESKIRRSFAENSITKNGPKNPASIITLPVGFPCVASQLELPRFEAFDDFAATVDAQGGYITRELTRTFSASYPIRLDKMEVVHGKLARQCRVYSGWTSASKLKSFIAADCNPIPDEDANLRYFLSANGVIYYQKEGRNSKYVQSILRNMGTTERSRYELEAMGLDFSYPKPKELIQYLISLICDKSDSVLDAFAGSGTTAHATMLANSIDGGKRQFICIEIDGDVFEKCRTRLEKVSNGYVPSGGSKKKPVLGVGCAFSVCKLDIPLFSLDGQISEHVRFVDLAHFIYFTETGEPLPKPNHKKSPLLGIANGVAVYLLYNGILQDKSPNGGNVLTTHTLEMLTKHAGPKVIYGTSCKLSSGRLRRESITFRQIPYQVKVR